MTTLRELPADCPCPHIRHPDGSPWVVRPDPDCPHHSRVYHAPPPATVTPIRRTPDA